MGATRDRKLTPKQEAFCQFVASGKSQSDAYREAYNTKSKPEGVHVVASRLAGEPRISLRIQELRNELSKKSLWTREESVNALKWVIDNHDKPSDITAAVKELNAMHGFNAPKQFEQLGPDGKPLDNLIRIKYIGG